MLELAKAVGKRALQACSHRRRTGCTGRQKLSRSVKAREGKVARDFLRDLDYLHLRSAERLTRFTPLMASLNQGTDERIITANLSNMDSKVKLYRPTISSN